MPHIKFPSHYLYWTQVKDHENIKSKLVPIIHNLISENKYTNPFKTCNMTTNFSKTIDFIDNEMKDKIIWKCLQEMVSDTNCFPEKNPTDTFITEYWFNVYEKGDFQEMHNHNTVPKVIDGKRYDTTFSIIYILNSDEEDNSTIFKLKWDTTIPYVPMLQECVFDTGSVKEIKEGTLLIFSNQLNHYVRPIKKSGRITIAFNVACCFE